MCFRRSLDPAGVQMTSGCVRLMRMTSRFEMRGGMAYLFSQDRAVDDGNIAMRAEWSVYLGQAADWV
jgi:hypothetical protein